MPNNRGTSPDRLLTHSPSWGRLLPRASQGQGRTLPAPRGCPRTDPSPGCKKLPLLVPQCHQQPQPPGAERRCWLPSIWVPTASSRNDGSEGLAETELYGSKPACALPEAVS